MALDLKILHGKMNKLVEEKTKKVVALAQDAMADRAKKGAILDSIGDCLLAIDNKGKIILVNKQTELFLGKTSDELLGLDAKKVYEVKDAFERRLSDKEKPLQRMLETGEKISGKYYCIHANKKFPVLVTSAR